MSSTACTSSTCLPSWLAWTQDSSARSVPHGPHTHTGPALGPSSYHCTIQYTTKPVCHVHMTCIDNEMFVCAAGFIQSAGTQREWLQVWADQSVLQTWEGDNFMTYISVMLCCSALALSITMFPWLNGLQRNPHLAASEGSSAGERDLDNKPCRANTWGIH